MNCPKCNLKLDETNRLVTEYCGHSKCRNCLIVEEFECKECKQNTGDASASNMYQTNTSVQNKIGILENTSNPQKETGEKGKRNRTQIPSFIESKKTSNGKVAYFCKICNKHFSSRTQQYYHMYCNDEQNKPHKCDKCPKSFSSLSHLKYHMEGHKIQSFSCNLCEKTFRKLAILRKHVKLHSQEKITCAECGMKFKDKTTFVGHEAKHKNIFEFNCDICDKSFSLKSTLHQHKAKHAGRKAFKCLKCGKAFQRNYTLKLHALKHTSEKIHSCSVCYKCFTDSNSLIRHLNIHEGRIKYKCTQCDILTVRKDNMIRHVRNMHPGVKYEDCIEIVRNNDTINNGNIRQQAEGNVPITIANSSVIKCVGNVEPIVIPLKKKIESSFKSELLPDSTNLQKDKKFKKKYDPFKIYRKILCSDDDALTDDEDNDNASSEATTSNVGNKQEQNPFYSSNSNLLNFSERHWRKNLNLRVKEDWQ